MTLSFVKKSFEWPKKYEILLTEYFLFQKPCKCHLINPQVSKGHTTGVLRTLPMVEPRPAFSHTVSSVCKPVWYMLHSTIQCTVIATCIMCTLYTRVGAWVSPPGVENELLKCCLYRGVGKSGGPKREHGIPHSSGIPQSPHSKAGRNNPVAKFYLLSQFCSFCL